MPYLILILVIVFIYIMLIYYFFAVLGPILIALVGAAAFLYVVGQYQRILYGVMAEPAFSEPSVLRHPPPDNTTSTQQPAYRQYFFGQAMADLRHVIELAWTKIKSTVLTAHQRIYQLAFQSELVLGTWPVGVVAYIGLAVGCVIGGIVLGSVIAVHAATVFIAQTFAVVSAYVLQYVDIGIRRARKIRVICPDCHEEIAFPSYRCPNGKCKAEHSDIRPGRYGVLHRVCRCGTSFPTLIMLGSHRLDAYCPNKACKSNLASGAGAAQDVVLPVLGPTAAGKTRLMASIMLTLEHAYGSGAGEFEIASKETEQELERQQRFLIKGEDTRATQVQLPRAYVAHARAPRGSRRLLYVFDPAGEMVSSTDRMQEQGKYLRLADSFTFVIDPLALPSVWKSLTPDRQNELEPFRPNMQGLRSADEVFANAVDNLRRLDVKTTSSRLAVCFSKSDLLGPTEKSGPASDEIATWLDRTAGLGNMRRSMETNFGEVGYFLTAAVTEGGVPDPSLRPYLNWLLGPSGLTL